MDTHTTDISFATGYDVAIMVGVTNIKVMLYDEYLRNKEALRAYYDHLISIDNVGNVTVEKTTGSLHINRIKQNQEGKLSYSLLITPPLSDPYGPRPGWNNDFS